MNQIENHNCAGICQQRTCGNLQTQFQIIKMENMEIMISLCDKHAEEFDKMVHEKTKTKFEMKEKGC